MQEFSPALYDSYIGANPKYELIGAPYGVSIRANKAGQIETARDTDCELSIFDTPCFNFYLIKYIEVIGIEPLVAVLSEHISEQKGQHNSKVLSYR